VAVIGYLLARPDWAGAMWSTSGVRASDLLLLLEHVIGKKGGKNGDGVDEVATLLGSVFGDRDEVPPS